MTQKSLTLVLACLASIGEGRRVQKTFEQDQRSRFTKPSGALDELEYQSQIARRGDVSALEALAKLLTFQPKAAFNPPAGPALGFRQRMRHPTIKLRLPTVHSSAVAEVSMSEDHFVNAVDHTASISVKACVTTNLTQENARLQGLGVLASAAVGRAMTCACLIAEGMEDDEQIQFTLNGGGPLNGVFAVCDGGLRVHGYCGNPKLELPTNELGKIDVGGGVGREGSVQVVRLKNLPGDPRGKTWSGVTEIVSGEVSEDIHNYLCTSEQRECALAAGVFCVGKEMGKSGSGAMVEHATVTATGGWYAQLLPNAKEEMIEKLEENIAKLAKRPPTALVREGNNAEDICKLLLDGMEPEILQYRRIPGIKESCKCSVEGNLQVLSVIPRDEMKQLMEEQEAITITCELCGEVYRMENDEIRTYCEKAYKERDERDKELEEYREKLKVAKAKMQAQGKKKDVIEKEEDAGS